MVNNILIPYWVLRNLRNFGNSLLPDYLFELGDIPTIEEMLQHRIHKKVKIWISTGIYEAQEPMIRYKNYIAEVKDNEI